MEFTNILGKKEEEHKPPLMAFPLYAMLPGKLAGQMTGIVQGGMELRDWFAAFAMQAFLLDQSRAGTHAGTPELIARDAFGNADAMLKEREVRNA